MPPKRKAEEQIVNPLKLCCTCKVAKPKDCFAQNQEKPDQLDPRCKQCHRNFRVKRKQKQTEMLTENPDALGTSCHCNDCKQTLPRKDFYDNWNTKSGKDSHCIICAKVRAFKRRLALDENVNQWHAARPCENCGEKNVKYLQACHIDRNSKSIGVRQAKSIKRQNSELPKCKSLCCFCHQIETDKENGTTTRRAVAIRREFVNAKKAIREKCIRCSMAYNPSRPSIFHFDHRNPETKVDSVAKMVTDQLSFERIEDEMEKCDLLCSKCHIDVTQERRDDEWRMFVEYCARGEECISDLSKRFNLSRERIINTINSKIEIQPVIERVYGDNWIDHVVIE
jgi:hypothetical protein